VLFVKLKSLMWAWPLALLVFVFWEPLTTTRTLFHPDWAPYFEEGNGAGFYEMFACKGAAPSFMSLLWAALPSRLFHLVFYPFCVMGICMAMYAFLRDRQLPRPACLAGAIAIGFSGYLLTLVSAGHRGVFEVMLTSVLTLYCVDRAIRGGGVLYLAVAGVVTAFSLGTQPDVLAMIGMFLAAYGLVACWMHRATIAGNWRRFSLGILVGITVLVVAGLPGLDKVRHSYLPGRQVIEKREILGAEQGERSSAQVEIAKAQKWEFCTNWSLPPRDALELGLPLLFGTETPDRKAPFWGELGRSLGWTPGAAGFRNYRQHTVYAGLIQILLALYAFVVVVMRTVCRKKEQVNEQWQVWFWSASVLISLLLAFGRYTPFYRLFYALPLADTIRCPVKFLHITNLSTAILAAYGLSFLLLAISNRRTTEQEQESVLRSAMPLVIACGVVAVVLTISLIVTKTSAVSLARYWNDLGYTAEFHKTMLYHMTAALARSAWLAAGLAGVVVWAAHRRSPRWAAGVLGVFVCAAMGLDMASVGRRFVHTADLKVHESRNDAVLDIKAAVAPRVLDLLTSRGPHDPLRVNLKTYYVNAIRLLDVDLKDSPELLARAGGNLERLTRLLVVTGTDYVLGRREQLLPLAKTPAFDLVAGYDFSGRVVRSTNPQRAPIALLRVRNALPRAALAAHARAAVVSSELPDLLFSPAFDPWREVLVGDAAVSAALGQSPLLPVAVTQSSRWRAEMTVDSTSGGIVLFNEPFHQAWSAQTDGKSTDIIRVNGAMMGIKVSSGRHHVVFKRTPGLNHFIFSTLPAFSLLLLAVCYGLWRRCRAGKPLS
jgi:hypothetical protein